MKQAMSIWWRQQEMPIFRKKNAVLGFNEGGGSISIQAMHALIPSALHDLIHARPSSWVM
eukprot:6490462-Amphidinium_carterae.2